MAINFETLKNFMPDIGLKNFDTTGEEEKSGRIVAGFQFDTGESDYPSVKAGVVVSLQEDGEFIQMRLIRILDQETKVMGSEFLPKLTQYLLKLNYENKIGRWCLDPSDGDLYVDWAIPVEDNEKVTLAQMKRMLRGLVASAREAFAPMNRILKTGSPDAPKSREDLIKDILLKLTELQQYGLIPKVAAVTDTDRLKRILGWLSAGDTKSVEADLAGSR